MAKPSDIYVSVLDFFAIILPGAIATAILLPHIDRFLPRIPVLIPVGETAQWIIFLVSSYFVGHLVFLLGSRIDPLFHLWREKCRRDIRKPGTPYACANEIRKSMLTSAEQSAVNTLQWARSVLLAKFASAAADVHRLEADSKFFRSLVILCAAISLILIAERRAFEGLGFAVLSVACTLRYGERRLKSEKQAYMHVIALYRLGLLSRTSANANAANSSDSQDANAAL